MNILHRNCIRRDQRLLNTGKSKVELLLNLYRSNSVHLREIMNLWTAKFEESNIPEAHISTQLIASHVLKISDLDKLDHFQEHELNDDQKAEFNRCGECRLARIPVQYIIGEWDFRDTKLKLVPPVFIPRPETEMLVDIIADNAGDVRTGLEIGCGSGAISIALLKKYPELRMKAIDQSKVACEVTLANAKLNHVETRSSIFHRKIEEDGTIKNFEIESMDFLVSNPPYLFTTELLQLEPEIKLYEDLRALDGGRDGLRVIKAIFLFSSKVLAPSKSCFIEIHHQHTTLIKNWLQENPQLNLRFSGGFKDFFGRDRFIRVIKQL